MKNPVTELSSRLCRFTQSERASVTVEFVILLPLLLLWFFGSVVYYDAFKSRGHAAQAAHTIANILSRKQTEVQDGEISKMLALQTALLAPDPAGRLRVSSVQFISSEDGYIVLWSETAGGGDALTDLDIPREILPLMSEAETVILVESSVPYIPMVDWVGISVKNLVTRIAISPRFSSDLRRAP